MGFDHEHKRDDREKYMNIAVEQMTNPQYVANGIELTAFDPFSIMMYCVGEGYDLTKKKGVDVWNQYKGEWNTELSELDKVGINLIYPPRKSKTYNPKISEKTGLYYCNRPVMMSH